MSSSERTGWIAAVVLLLLLAGAATALALRERGRVRSLERAIDERADTAHVYQRAHDRCRGDVDSICAAIEEELGVDTRDDQRFPWCAEMPCAWGWMQ